MKRGTVLAILILLFLSASGLIAAEDFLQGEVLAVDRDNMRLSVIVNPGGEDEHVATIALSEDILIETRSGARQLPGCIRLGNHVRIWGRNEYRASGEQFFHVTEIRGCGMKDCNDPTGVRKRLFRGRDM